MSISFDAEGGASRRCRDCGSPFRLTPGQVHWFTQRGLELPARCADCRAARRAAADS